MSYSVKNDKKINSTPFADRVLLSEQLCRANSQIIRLLSPNRIK